MSATNKACQEPTVTLSFSIEDEELTIENSAHVKLSNQSLLMIANTILSKFKINQLCQETTVQAFVNEVLTGMPEEGGAIPLDNIIDWVQLSFPMVSPFFSNYSEDLVLASVEETCVA